jgi:hypothetical protein
MRMGRGVRVHVRGGGACTQRGGSTGGGGRAHVNREGRARAHANRERRGGGGMCMRTGRGGAHARKREGGGRARAQEGGGMHTTGRARMRTGRKGVHTLGQEGGAHGRTGTHMNGEGGRAGMHANGEGGRVHTRWGRCARERGGGGDGDAPPLPFACVRITLCVHVSAPPVCVRPLLPRSRAPRPIVCVPPHPHSCHPPSRLRARAPPSPPGLRAGAVRPWALSPLLPSHTTPARGAGVFAPIPLSRLRQKKSIVYVIFISQL